MPLYTDQTGREVPIDAHPKRIVSLVPSQTELLFHLGLEEEVIGITKFCIHPATWFRTKTRIGGTKQLHLEKIRSLQPDLILANKEENSKEQVEELAVEFPVWVSDVNDLDGAVGMIRSLGIICRKEKESERIISAIHFSFLDLAPSGSDKKTAYLIWKDPLMTVGGDTFIHDMLRRAGFQNMFLEKSRYPQTSAEELNRLGCEVLLLASEPYPFNQKHLAEFRELMPRTAVHLVDGEMFSWYGSRLMRSAAYFRELQQRIGLIS